MSITTRSSSLANALVSATTTKGENYSELKDDKEDVIDNDRKDIGVSPNNVCHHEWSSCSSSYPSWDLARTLQPPVVSATDHGEAEGAEWWLEHEQILQEAWVEWTSSLMSSSSSLSSLSSNDGLQLPPLNDTLIDPTLRTLVQQAHAHPTTDIEDRVRLLWHDVMPTTTTTTTTMIPDTSSNNDDSVLSHPQFLTPEGIVAIRTHLDAIERSGIPLRRPNAMNRYGMMLDPSVPGGVGSSTPIMIFIHQLVQEYIRPLGRMFFPTYVGSIEDDCKAYAFTIRYSSMEDIELNEHSDASVISINMNLNLPQKEQYEGSSIYFVPSQPKKHNQFSLFPSSRPSNSNKIILNLTNTDDQEQLKQQQHQQKRDKRRHEITFWSGMALLHRGMTRHGALPIQSGSRYNLVIWLYGRDGTVRIAPYEDHEHLTVSERWHTVPQ